MNIFSKRFLFLLMLLMAAFDSHNLFGQSDRFNVDSINVFVAKLSSDSEKVKALIDRAADIYCEDSANKLIIANEARNLAEKIKWRRGIYDANYMLGKIYYSCLKNYDKAFEYFEENITIAKKNGDKPNQILALDNAAKFYQKSDNHVKALELFEKILALDPDIDWRIAVLGDIGVVYNAINDNKKALEYYNNSLNVLDSFVRSKKTGSRNDTLLRAGLLINIGDIHLAMPQPDLAFENYSEVRKISIAIQDKQFEIWSLVGIGKTFKEKKDYPKALKNYEAALKISDSIHQYHDEVKILNEIANTYLETWALTEALTYADSALRLAETQHYIDLLSRANATFGNVYLKQNKYDLAIFYLQRALSIAQQNNVLIDKKDAWFGLSDAYEHSGQSALALAAFKHFKSLNDSLTSLEQAKELQKVTLERQFSQEKQKSKEEYVKRIERQKMFTYYGYAGLALVVLLAFFIFRNYKIQKKYNELLSKEKKSHLAHIKAQSNILSDIAHTQAHDVRGPVATILGLVNLFNYEDATDPMNKQVMEWIGSTTEKLDNVVKDVIIKENKLRGEHKEESEGDLRDMPPAK
jgi:tetratricopeptide (TPR) repeat protein